MTSRGGNVAVDASGSMLADTHEDASAGVTRPSRSQQLTTFFRNPEFLRFVGGTLKTTNVLDYFATSDFFERSCNNAVLAMQGGGAAGIAANAAAAAATAAGQAPNEVARIWEEKRSDPVLLEAELRRFVGLEYVLAHAKPPELFVIHKRWRSSAVETRVLEAYYVLHGNVHMAGDLFNVLGSRLLSATTALGASLSLARNAQPDFNAREGYAWRIAAEKAPAEDDESEQDERDADGVAGVLAAAAKDDTDAVTADEALASFGKDRAANDKVGKMAPQAAAMTTAPSAQSTRTDTSGSSGVKTRRQSRDDAPNDTAPKRRRTSKAA